MLAIYVALRDRVEGCPAGSIPGEHDVASCCPAGAVQRQRGVADAPAAARRAAMLDIQKARALVQPPPEMRTAWTSGIGEVGTNHSCTPLQQPRTHSERLNARRGDQDPDRRSAERLGATLAERIMLARLNLTGVAAASRRPERAYPLL